MSLKGKISKVLDCLASRSNLFKNTSEQLKKTENDLKKVENDLRQSNNRIFILDKENRELSERVSEISEKLCKVSVLKEYEKLKLRIALDIDSRIIETGLIHGGDDLMIKYIGADIGHRAASEIRRANFQRWEK